MSMPCPTAAIRSRRAEAAEGLACSKNAAVRKDTQYSHGMHVMAKAMMCLASAFCVTWSRADCLSTGYVLPACMESGADNELRRVRNVGSFQIGFYH